MEFLLINQYYPPDEAPTGYMLEAVATRLMEAGHSVTVICSQGGYAGASTSQSLPDAGSRPRVVRISATRFGRSSYLGKVCDYLSYYTGVARQLVFGQSRGGRVVALTTPPFLSLIARLGSRLRGGDHAHWIMDLYPDVMSAHGILKESSFTYRLLARLSRAGFGGSRCAAIITLGPDMAEKVGTYLTNGAPAWVPLWGTSDEVPLAASRERDEAVRELRRQRGWRDDEIVVMYSGNMGRGHRFGEILEAALMLARDPEGSHRLRFAFFGGGKRKSEVSSFMREYPEARIELHDYVPKQQLADHLRSADIHLASLEPQWSGTMVPSKLQGIFAASRPVAFIGSPSSAIGQWIAESDAGRVILPGDPTSLATTLLDWISPEERSRRGSLAVDFAKRHFDRERNSRAIAELLLTPRKR